MADSLPQRAFERKIYEEIVDMIVDVVYKEFEKDLEARLRIYTLVAENFAGMVKVFSPSLKEGLSSVILTEEEPEDE